MHDIRAVGAVRYRLRGAWASAVLLFMCLGSAACSGGDPALGPTPTHTATAIPTATRTPVVLPTPTPIPKAPAELTRIENGGQRRYLHGANLPWRKWGCDFGCGSNDGASSDDAQAELDSVFRSASESGIQIVRWWMFPGEPTQFVTAAGTSHPVSVKATVFTDIDAALALAQRHNVSLVFVLFSAPGHLPGLWLSDSDARAALVSVLGTLFEHYRADPRVFAWEVFNEPEWDIWSGRVSQRDLVQAVKAVADSVHEKGHARVSVGSANIEGLPIWVGLGLDYYDVHWYDPMSPSVCARCITYDEHRAKYQLDRPLVVGEFYAGADVDALKRFEDFYERRYAGAWAWSLMPNATNDRMTIDLQASRQFTERRHD